MPGEEDRLTAGMEKFYLHATAAVIGEAGILIMGRTGAGKSKLALALIAAAEAAGTFARLVGDDRIGIERRGDRIIARGHRAILGKIERRGHGIGEIPFLAAAVVRLVVSLGGQGHACPPRLPDEAEANTVLAGLRLPFTSLRQDAAACDLAASVLADPRLYGKGR
ncbi:aldolase [Methylocapsa sp. D3K7]|uniref:HPr kinase/phosphorylase n=1 Tax=Methylocapsa sp. D3K7 TaxID=3041435 RepID=UPI00244E77B1|nr:aldolase [Methylocapsa sp. D3K7]WGJ13041.1 aldolase [Methylocapsa sp. D3K7]